MRNKRFSWLLFWFKFRSFLWKLRTELNIWELLEKSQFFSIWFSIVNFSFNCIHWAWQKKVPLRIETTIMKFSRFRKRTKEFLIFIDFFIAAINFHFFFGRRWQSELYETKHFKFIEFSEHSRTDFSLNSAQKLKNSKKIWNVIRNRDEVDWELLKLSFVFC